MNEPDSAELFRILTRLEQKFDRMEARFSEYVHREVYFADKETQALRWKTLVDDIEEQKQSNARVEDRQADFRKQVIISFIVFALGLLSAFIVSGLANG